MQHVEFNTETGEKFLITVLSQNPSMFKLIKQAYIKKLIQVMRIEALLVSITD